MLLRVYKKYFLLICLLLCSIKGVTQFKGVPDTVVGIFYTNSLYPNPPDSVSVGSLVIPNGTYIGNERMSIDKNRLWPGYLKSTDTNNDSLGREWFHEVSIYIKDSLLRITKTPFYIKNKKKFYTDSIGGIYVYSDLKENVVYETIIDGKTQKRTYDSTFTTISASLDSRISKNIYKINSDAVPLYVYIIYTVRMKGKNLLIDADYQKKILFRRVKSQRLTQKED